MYRRVCTHAGVCVFKFVCVFLSFSLSLPPSLFLSPSLSVRACLDLDAVVVVLDEHHVFGFKVTMNHIDVGLPHRVKCPQEVAREPGMCVCVCVCVCV